VRLDADLLLAVFVLFDLADVVAVDDDALAVGQR